MRVFYIYLHTHWKSLLRILFGSFSQRWRQTGQPIPGAVCLHTVCPESLFPPGHSLRKCLGEIPGAAGNGTTDGAVGVVELSAPLGEKLYCIFWQLISLFSEDTGDILDHYFNDQVAFNRWIMAKKSEWIICWRTEGPAYEVQLEMWPPSAWLRLGKLPLCLWHEFRGSLEENLVMGRAFKQYNLKQSPRRPMSGKALGLDSEEGTQVVNLHNGPAWHL